MKSADPDSGMSRAYAEGRVIWLGNWREEAPDTLGPFSMAPEKQMRFLEQVTEGHFKQLGVNWSAEGLKNSAGPLTTTPSKPWQRWVSQEAPCQGVPDIISNSAGGSGGAGPSEGAASHGHLAFPFHRHGSGTTTYQDALHHNRCCVAHSTF